MVESSAVWIPKNLRDLGVNNEEMIDFMKNLPAFWESFGFQELENISEYFYKAHPLTVALLEKTGLL